MVLLIRDGSIRTDETSEERRIDMISKLRNWQYLFLNSNLSTQRKGEKDQCIILIID